MSLSLPRWFAHRGGGSLAPENTLAGIRLAARLGYRAVEFDVMLSGDGTPVLIHDETLDRTTNGVGRVCEASDGMLSGLDAGAGERIPLFSQAAALCRELDLLANVEIKPACGFERQTAEEVARQLRAHWQGAKLMPLVSSFSLETLDIARVLAPEFPRGVLFDHVPDDWRQVMQRLKAVSLHCNARNIDDDVLQAAADDHVPVLCYTVNDAAQAGQLFERGVTSAFTDRLDLFAGETSAYKALQLGG